MRTRHRLRGFLTCIVPLLAILAGAAPAPAQQPSGDCAPDSDLVLREPHGRLLQVVALFIVAPSALLLLGDESCEREGPRPGFGENHVAVYGAGGFAFTGDWRGGVARSAGIEALFRGVYLEGRVDRTSLSDGVRMWDARAGYFIHPIPELAGGVTVGYREVRDAPGDWTQGGVLIGFPIVLTGCGKRSPCWMQWEPTYVIGGGELAVSPRARVDVTIPRTPLVARLDFESRGVRHRDPMVLAIGLGLRP